MKSMLFTLFYALHESKCNIVDVVRFIQCTYMQCKFLSILVWNKPNLYIMQIKPVRLSKEGTQFDIYYSAFIGDNGYCVYQNYLFEVML